MPSADEILSFNFDFSSFRLEAKKIIPLRTQSLMEARISKLNDLSNKLGKNPFPIPKELGIKQVFRKFKQLKDSPELLSISLDKRELRTLTYALNHSEPDLPSIFRNLSELEVALDLLKNNWRDSYLYGLVNCCLSNWDSNQTLSLETLRSFCTGKINQYQGTRKILLSLKSNAKFIDNTKGDLDLGYTLALAQKPISEAPNFLNLPASWFAHAYFTKVILGNLEKNKSDLSSNIDELIHALELHTNSTKGAKASKVIISRLIVHCDASGQEIVQDKIKRIAFKLIGDPGITKNWLPFENATELWKTEIFKARDILNEWITREFITVFFEKCINDVRRKKFWLKYSRNISSFKVFGPKQLKRALKADKRIAEYVDGRFREVVSKRDISAFLFKLGSHNLVEFSDKGYAFFAYKNNSSNVPSFDNKHYESVDEFRDGSLPMLVYRNGYNLHTFSDEGRLSHNDGDMRWEEVFATWINKKVGINV